MGIKTLLRKDKIHKPLLGWDGLLQGGVMGELIHLVNGQTSRILGFTWEGYVSHALRNGLGEQLRGMGFTYGGDLRILEGAEKTAIPDYYFKMDEQRVIGGDAKAGGYTRALRKVKHPDQLVSLIHQYKGVLSPAHWNAFREDLQYLQPDVILILQPEEVYTRPRLKTSEGSYFFIPAGSLERILRERYPYLMQQPAPRKKRIGRQTHWRILHAMAGMLNTRIPMDEHAYKRIENTLLERKSEDTLRGAYARLMLSALGGSRLAASTYWRVQKHVFTHGERGLESLLQAWEREAEARRLYETHPSFQS